MNKSFHKKRFKKKEKPEFDQQILDLARVTRVTKGGKYLSFRVCVVLGDRKGRVGLGLAKGKDVQIGVEKAVRKAKKNMIKVPMVDETIAHALTYKFKAGVVLLKPAPKGSGIIAGGALRALLDLAGVPNISAKIMSKTKNKVTIAKAAFEALQKFQSPKHKNTETQKHEDDKNKVDSPKQVMVSEDKDNSNKK